MILGLTGGMGCGKSTAARLFVELGYRLIDSDALVKTEILTSPELIGLAQQRWGDSVLDSTGQLDRRRLAETVFPREQELKQLEAWVHPRLFARWRQLLSEDPAADWIIEVPLLFEKQLENWFDFIVCVASSADVQLARLIERGIPHTLAEQRISKQLPLARKIALADLVLWNDGPIPFLRAQVQSLHQAL